jgi:DNA-binding transcriptional regulator GbsR (MarR family)
MQLLQISRGNANMNLRSLINWNLVRKVHQSGSRKDFYTAEKDVWKITARVIKEREKREIQPVMQQLQECREILQCNESAPESVKANRSSEMDSLSEKERLFCGRIDNLIELMEVFEGFSRALFPFIQERSIAEAKQLIEIAGNLTAGSQEDAASDESHR